MWARLGFGGKLFGGGSKVTDKQPAESGVAQLHAAYELHEELGRGAYGRVVRAVRRSTGEEVAVKVIAKGAKEKEDARLQVEVDILRRVRHPNLIRLHDVFDTPDTLYLVMQLCRGGELFDRIIARKKFSEEAARRTVASLLSALEYLHAQGVAHRDLKPENILLVGKEGKAGGDDIVLTDFGLSKFNSDEDTQMSTICGSPSYIAPEVLAMQGYGKECDLWSLGVITYILLCGYPPFHADDNIALFRKIRMGQWAFQSPWWDGVSAGGKDFIRRLLVLNPADRLTATTALAHPWLQGVGASAHARAVSASAAQRANGSSLWAQDGADGGDNGGGTHRDMIDRLASHMAAQLKFKKALKSTKAMVRLKLAVLRAFQSVGSTAPGADGAAGSEGDAAGSADAAQMAGSGEEDDDDGTEEGERPTAAGRGAPRLVEATVRGKGKGKANGIAAGEDEGKRNGGARRKRPLHDSGGTAETVVGGAGGSGASLHYSTHVGGSDGSSQPEPTQAGRRRGAGRGNGTAEIGVERIGPRRARRRSG